jgi:polyferredoxin
MLLFVYILWSTTYPLTGLLSPDLIFKIDPLVVFFTALSERVIVPGLWLSAAMLALTLVLGRFFCGWVCPLGTFIDWAGAVRKKKPRLSEGVNRKVRRIKFWILALVTILAAVGVQAAWVFDPLVIAARFVSLNLIPTVTLAANESFKTLIQNFNLYGGFYDFYRSLKASFLGVNAHYFSNSGTILSIFLIVVLSAYFLQRVWCRTLCPLGAIYCLTGKPALLERQVGSCIGCQICVNRCRMGAIKEDSSYVKGECILCMDCVYNCPEQQTQFLFGRRRPVIKACDGEKKTNTANGISRKDFLFFLAASFSVLGFRDRNRFGGDEGKARRPSRKVIRPPGALRESEFVDRCIRCGNCMKVCPTNGLQPVMAQTGIEGVWTPELVPEIGECEYNCNYCGNVCPTGAIQKLTLSVKQEIKIGHARIDRSICFPWAEKRECIVCEEHCPVPDKAIKLEEEIVDGRKILKPTVNHHLCIGCGLCQRVCPARPVRAIRVSPL